MTRRTELLERAPCAVLPERGGAVLCAVSGGLDSMCLLHMLDGWCKARGGRVIAAHFNHQLRGAAADRDETFVRKICEQWGILLTVGRGNVRDFAKREGQTVEEAARTLRYAFLRQAAETEGCGHIYTAHHADDNAETILLNLLRGTGLKGLTGMERQRDMILRPLLDVTRAELEAYASQWDVPHSEDETNQDPETASRNLLRLQVMPLLKELNPRAAEHICGTAERLRIIDGSLERDAAERTAHVEVREGRVTLAADAIFGAPYASAAVRPAGCGTEGHRGGACKRAFGYVQTDRAGKRDPHQPPPWRHRPVLPEMADSGDPASALDGDPAHTGPARPVGRLYTDASGPPRGPWDRPAGPDNLRKPGGKGSSLHTRGPADPAGKPGGAER